VLSLVLSDVPAEGYRRFVRRLTQACSSSEAFADCSPPPLPARGRNIGNPK
jgi:hypothetical protein